MKPRPVTEEDCTYWGGTKLVMKAPEGLENCEDLETVKCFSQYDESILIRSPWVLENNDFLDALQGTIWLTTYGGMPPVTMHFIAFSEGIEINE